MAMSEVGVSYRVVETLVAILVYTLLAAGLTAGLGIEAVVRTSTSRPTGTLEATTGRPIVGPLASMATSVTGTAQTGRRILVSSCHASKSGSTSNGPIYLSSTSLRPRQRPGPTILDLKEAESAVSPQPQRASGASE